MDTEGRRRRQTDSKVRKFWHDWMPILTFCASALGCFGGMVAAVTSYKVTLETKLSDLQTGQKETKDALSSISQEHHTLMVDDVKQNVKIDKIMFRLRIPIDDVTPDYHTWPLDQRKGPDANLDQELEKLYNDKHSRSVPPDPMLGLMRVPLPTKVSSTDRTGW